MPFWDISQNNSGGHFDVDHGRGIGEKVIVEARDSGDAIDRAEAIGLYWSGVDAGRDCDCCGDRWSRPDGIGTSEPMIYGEPLVKFLTEKRYGYRDNIYIHFMNKTFVKAGEYADPVLRDLAKIARDILTVDDKPKKSRVNRR